jgi:hypothetical protein
MANTNTVINFPGVAEVAGLVMSPSGGQVVFVGTSAILAGLGDTGEAIASRSFTSANQALSQCVSGRGDYIYLLPGYTENITADAWSNLAATDVTVCGLGHGSNRPALTWTVAGSTMLFDVASFRLMNCQLFLAGPHVAGAALTVTAPITVSAPGCEISDCRIFWGFNATQNVAIGITTTIAADDFNFDRNYCRAETLAVPTTTFLRLTGADYLDITNSYISGPGSTTAIGPVQMLTTGCLGARISGSVFQNTLAASTIAFTAIAGSTGNIDKCAFGVLAAGNGLTTGSGIQVTASFTAVGAAAGAATTG